MDCHALFRGDFRVRAGGRGCGREIPRHCPICGGTHIVNRGVVITRDAVDVVINDFVNYLTN